MIFQIRPAVSWLTNFFDVFSVMHHDEQIGLHNISANDILCSPLKKKTSPLLINNDYGQIDYLFVIPLTPLSRSVIPLRLRMLSIKAFVAWSCFADSL